MREQKKEGRRSAIIEAAEALIRESGTTGFSMVELGKKAGLSTVTTYNLIGSKAAVFEVLLNRCMDRVQTAALFPRDRSDPFKHIFQAADNAVRIYTSDPVLYRPLMRFLLGIPDPTHRPGFMNRGFRFWRTVVQELVDAEYLRDGLEANDVARDFQMYFAGAIVYWVHDQLDASQFRAQVRHGTALRLLALGHEDVADQLLREVKLARRRMASKAQLETH
jgi:AcrR family transcriptional regulator